jgi:phage portal protein BeeE
VDVSNKKHHRHISCRDCIGNALTQWLAPAFGAEVKLVVDVDRIPALANDRAALWEMVTKAPFLTPNEKRALTGFAPVGGADSL